MPHPPHPSHWTNTILTTPRITEVQYYEAQQQTRVVAARYIKSRDWTSAINILHSVALSLLQAQQGGSGGDLSIFLVSVYAQAELVPDASNKGKLLALLRAFDSEEPTRKKFIAEMIAWSAKFGLYPAGDTDLHHVAGSLYASEHSAIDAERHLLLGTRDSAPLLAELEYTWYSTDAPHTAPIYCARGVLPYLLLGNLRDANTVYSTFTSTLLQRNPSIPHQTVLSTTHFPTLPLQNFLGLLLLAVEKGSASADLFRNLRQQYREAIREQGWEEPLDGIAEIYFGIQRPRVGNPLMDMMGGLFGGGGQPKRQPQRRVGAAPQGGAAPVAEGLD